MTIFHALKIPKNVSNCNGSLLKNTKCVRYEDLSQGSKSCKLDIPWHKVLPTGKRNLLNSFFFFFSSFYVVIVIVTIIK